MGKNGNNKKMKEIKNRLNLKIKIRILSKQLKMKN